MTFRPGQTLSPEPITLIDVYCARLRRRAPLNWKCLWSGYFNYSAHHRHFAYTQLWSPNSRPCKHKLVYQSSVMSQATTRSLCRYTYISICLLNVSLLWCTIQDAILYRPDDGGSKHLRNIGQFIQGTIPIQ
jgi:hypothetical protein